ncbi:hypothetical protein NXX09_04365 [Bacteroides uniformis]|nr:hypothetical protein [Bacteroides uniformis]
MKGCTVELHRVAASGTTDATGTFNLNVSDPKRPVISFYGGTYSLHNEGFDDVCSNYTNDIKIIECTPYLLQVATMRTNSEGPWWLVWNFISEEAYNDPRSYRLKIRVCFSLPKYNSLPLKIWQPNCSLLKSTVSPMWAMRHASSSMMKNLMTGHGGMVVLLLGKA